jgi:predicted DNA-binding ribbon-helix-helix protein
MNSSVIKKRSIVVAGRRTSISLEDDFWKSLREIAGGRGETLSRMIASIDEDRQFANLSSAIRLFVLRYYHDQVAQKGGIVISRTVAPSITAPSATIKPFPLKIGDREPSG